MEKQTAKVEAKIPKILIGIPVLSYTNEFVESFLKFWTDLMMYDHSKRRFHVAYKFIYRKPVHIAEEQLAELAVNSGCTHLLLMDDDIYDVTAEDLFKLLDADKDFISGVMFTGGFPHAMCAFRRYNTEESVAAQPDLGGPARLYELPEDQRVGIQEVDLSAFPFTLIKTSVFNMLQKPWFECNTQAPTDSWFADKLLNSGLKFHVHFDVYVNHRGITKHNRQAWVQLGMLNAQAKDKNVLILTPEEMARHEAYMRAKLVAAEEKIKAKELEGIKFEKVGEVKGPISSDLVGQTADSAPKEEF